MGHGPAVLATIVGLMAALYSRHGRQVRTKLTAELRRIQERYLSLFNRSQECVYLLDFDGRFCDANPAALELLGYTREEIPTTDLTTLIDQGQMQQAMERIDELKKTGRTAKTAEFKVRRKDGQFVFVECRAAVIFQNGKPLAIQGIARDITTRKRAEESLRQSEELFRALAENMHAAVGMVQGTRFVYANRYMSEMLGYSAEEILSLDFPMMVHPAHRERMIDLARRRQLGEDVPGQYEFIALTKAGEERWIDFTAARTFHQGRPAIIGAGFDITDTKRAQQQLEAHTRGVKLLADTATRLLSAEDPRDMLHEIFDELGDHLGIQVHWSYLMTEDPTLLRIHTAHGLGEAALRRLEFAKVGQTPCGIAAHEGRRVIVDAVQQSDDPKTKVLRELGVRAYACYPLVVHDRVIGTLSYCAFDRDHFNEEELELIRAVSHQAAMALEHQRLTAELQRHAADLAEANQAKDHFMAILSHELRTPLTPVLAAASVLEGDKTVPAHAREDLEMIRRNVDLEARLIDDLLDVTRIVRGKIELDKHPVELCTVIRRAVQICKEDLEARHLQFTWDTGPAAPYWIEADAERLQQVFWNLLKNSIKFTPPEGRVGIRCHPHDNYVAIEVSDSGEGIAPEALGRIFKPFEQAERAITRQFGGLGLGLAITRALVELHGGTISAHSPGKGQGATFRVDLPLAKPEHAAERQEGQETRPSGPDARTGARRALRILLVEDHTDTAKMLARLLRSHGYQVQHAGDVATAEQLADGAQRSGEPFDLLLSDLGLPDASGHDLMRHLRAQGQVLPGIALSGYGMASDMEQSRAAGFAEHVTKPVNFADLETAITKVVRPTRSGRPGQAAP